MAQGIIDRNVKSSFLPGYKRRPCEPSLLNPQVAPAENRAIKSGPAIPQPGITTALPFEFTESLLKQWQIPSVLERHVPRILMNT